MKATGQSEVYRSTLLGCHNVLWVDPESQMLEDEFLIR